MGLDDLLTLKIFWRVDEHPVEGLAHGMRSAHQRIALTPLEDESESVTRIIVREEAGDPGVNKFLAGAKFGGTRFRCDI